MTTDSVTEGHVLHSSIHVVVVAVVVRMAKSAEEQTGKSEVGRGERSGSQKGCLWPGSALHVNCISCSVMVSLPSGGSTSYYHHRV